MTRNEAVLLAVALARNAGRSDEYDHGPIDPQVLENHLALTTGLDEDDMILVTLWLATLASFLARPSFHALLRSMLLPEGDADDLWDGITQTIVGRMAAGDDESGLPPPG
jgi:hypothetical protein